MPGSYGSLTYRELEARARGMALALDELGVEHGERVAIVSPNSGRFLTSYFGVSGYGRTLVPINFRLTSDEIAYVVQHSGASVLLYDPDLADEVGSIKVAHRFCLDGVDDAALSHPQPTARCRGSGSPRRTRLLRELHVGYHGAAQGRAADPTQLLAERGDLRVAHRGQRSRRAPAHAADVPLQRLGHAYAVTGMGGTHIVLRKVDGEDILSRIERHGVTLLCGAPAVVAAILSAAETRAAEGRSVPGRGTVRIVVAGAPPPSRTIERVESELGWEFIQIYGLTETAPLLTINRAPAEWDDLDAVTRSQLLSRAGVPALGVQIALDEDGEVLARSNHVFAGYWEQPARDGCGAAGRVVPHGRRRPPRRRVCGHLGSQEGRDHHRR